MLILQLRRDNTTFNPNLPGLFCEIKFLGGGGGGHYGPPPKISTMDGPINLKIGTDTEKHVRNKMVVLVLYFTYCFFFT